MDRRRSLWRICHDKGPPPRGPAAGVGIGIDWSCWNIATVWRITSSFWSLVRWIQQSPDSDPWYNPSPSTLSSHRTQRGRPPGMSGKPWEPGLRFSLNVSVSSLLRGCRNVIKNHWRVYQLSMEYINGWSKCCISGLIWTSRWDVLIKIGHCSVVSSGRLKTQVALNFPRRKFLLRWFSRCQL